MLIDEGSFHVVETEARFRGLCANGGGLRK